MKSETFTGLLVKILTATASDAEKERFEAWLNEAESNKLYFKKIMILWEGINESYNNIEFDQETAKEKIQAKIQQLHSRTRVLKARFRIAAGCFHPASSGIGVDCYLYPQTQRKQLFDLYFGQSYAGNCTSRQFTCLA